MSQVAETRPGGRAAGDSEGDSGGMNVSVWDVNDTIAAIARGRCAAGTLTLVVYR